MLVLVSKRLYKYQHKKVNKKIFLVLIFNFFIYNLRAKRIFRLKNASNFLTLNGFKVFHIDSVETLQFFNNSVGIALSY